MVCGSLFSRLVGGGRSWGSGGPKVRGDGGVGSWLGPPVSAGWKGDWRDFGSRLYFAGRVDVVHRQVDTLKAVGKAEAGEFDRIAGVAVTGVMEEPTVG